MDEERADDANRCAGREIFFSREPVYITQKMVRVAWFTAIPVGHELGLIRSDSARFGRLASRTLVHSTGFLLSRADKDRARPVSHH